MVKRQGLPKSRTFATIVGVRPRFKVGVHNNTLPNVLRGLRERVYLVDRGAGHEPPPEPEPGVFQNLGRFAEAVVKGARVSGPWSYEEFVLSYTGPKQRIYQDAVDSLARRGLEPQDGKLDTFVKAEKLDLESKADPAPRVIQPRTPRFNAYVGRYLKALEKRIYQAIDEVFGEKTVLSGYNALDTARLLRNKWDSYDDCIAVGLDASRFDQHVSVQALEWEHDVYNAIYNCPRLRSALRWQVTNRGKVRLAEAIVTYSVAGRRMSGDMNTSMGNKLIMCALVWRYALERAIPLKLGNNGDDCVVFMRRRHLAGFQRGLTEWFTRYGFTLVVEEPVDVFEKIEFCQQRPVFDGERWIMTRSPVKGVAKDCTMLGVNPGSIEQHYATWAGGVGTAGLLSMGGIPVVQDIYKGLRSMAGGRAVELCTYSGLGVAAKGMKRDYAEPTPQCRASYYLAWGIEPHAQALMEEAIRSAFEARTGPEMIELVSHLSIPNLTRRA